MIFFCNFAAKTVACLFHNCEKLRNHYCEYCGTANLEFSRNCAHSHEVFQLLHKDKISEPLCVEKLFQNYIITTWTLSIVVCPQNFWKNVNIFNSAVNFSCLSTCPVCIFIFNLTNRFFKVIYQKTVKANLFRDEADIKLLHCWVASSYLWL